MTSPLDSYAHQSHSHFSKFAAEYSASTPQRVGWSSRATQFARFKVLCEVGNVRSSSILDVGCGVGDLFQYLAETGFEGHYEGLDLLESNVVAANLNLRKEVCTAGDVMSVAGEQQYDYVLASGIFGLPHEDWELIVKSTLQKMFSLCRKGVAANFLSIFAAKENDYSYHVHPSVVTDICVHVLGTRSFVIRHEYSPKNNDFTLYAYRE